jgi:hypothetical protein
MLYRHADRHGRHDIAVGDSLRLPYQLPRPLSNRVDPPYRHGTFDVIAFPIHGDLQRAHRFDRPAAHCITIRRRADGWTTTIAAHHWIRVREGGAS